MPNIGRLIKAGSIVAKYAREPASKAAKRLIGEEIGGRVVKSVTKGVGDWRYLLFEDGTAQPVKRMMLNDHKTQGDRS